MKFKSRNSLKERITAVLTFTIMFLSSEGALFSLKPDEVATMVGKAFIHKLPAETAMHSGYTFKLHATGSQDLPSWLAFEVSKNVLLGIPSHHDKGSHPIQLDVVSDETNKTVEVINLLTINVVQYDEDFNHYNMLRPSSLIESSPKNATQSPLDCPGRMPVIVATLVFDLSARKLTGSQRVDVLRSVSHWLGIDEDQLRLLPGKGDKTAFNLKDVILLTAGPGWVKDSQERGVCVSWKIGCGSDIAGSESVFRLKAASEKGDFKRELKAPVVAWHVTHGLLKHRQVVRVRRQAPGQTPIPTSAPMAPTVATVTRTRGIMGTPTLAPSPSILTVTPTAARISPSPPVTVVIPTSAIEPPTPPTPQPPQNTPPYLHKPIGTLTAEVGVEFVFPVPAETFKDKEDGWTPNLLLEMYDKDANPVPPDLWVKLDGQTFRGIPEVKDLGETVVRLIVTDSGRLMSNKTDKVTINIVLKNEPPRLINHIDLIKLYVGQPIKFRVPYDTFYDQEDGDTDKLTLSMTTIDGAPLPLSSWVTFDASNHTIYALPRWELGKPEFQMIATDSGGKKARDAFEFHIVAVKQTPNHYFGLVLDAPFKKYEDSVIVRVELCILIGGHFGSYFNTSYKDIRVKNAMTGSIVFEWCFANIATDRAQVELYKEQYVTGVDDEQPVPEFKERADANCPVQKNCPVEKVYVVIENPPDIDPSDPNVVGRVKDRGGGKWWKYTIIPAFVVAALIFIIGLIIIMCIRCRRRTKVEKNDKVVFLYRKKPAVFREEYPTKEAYGNQPLISPSEKPPLPPPAYPRSSTPTEDSSVLLMSESSPSYQPPSFDSGNEQAANTCTPVASYRLPPPYVAP